MVPVVRRAVDVEIVTGARGFCSFLVPVARGAIEVEVVTGARGLCSLLVPVDRGVLEIEVVTGARGHEVGLLAPRAPPPFATQRCP